jgi:hypothetical protein
MKTNIEIVNDRPVLDRKETQDISQEPEMKALVEVDHGMTEGEKARALRYLKGQKED